MKKLEDLEIGEHIEVDLNPNAKIRPDVYWSFSLDKEGETNIPGRHFSGYVVRHSDTLGLVQGWNSETQRVPECRGETLFYEGTIDRYRIITEWDD